MRSKIGKVVLIWPSTWRISPVSNCGITIVLFLISLAHVVHALSLLRASATSPSPRTCPMSTPHCSYKPNLPLPAFTLP